MRNALCFTLTFAFSLVLAADANAQRGRGGFRPQTEDQKKKDETIEPAGRLRGGRFGGTAEDQPAGRGRGRGGRFGGGQAQAGGSAGGGRFGGGGSTNKLFAAIDADGDGVITKAEMEDAILAFARLDEDKDGKLTKEEAGATGGGHGHGHGGGGMAGGRGRFGGNQSEQGAGQPQGRGRGGFGRGQRPELEQPTGSKEPAAAENKPAAKSSGTSKSPFDDE
ncbi:MAG: hypothetical protein NXI04_03450 [Planctomycetaceae bacterium]|nr:hypothetical protein [Planctomycetaceae bacterium]